MEELSFARAPARPRPAALDGSNVAAWRAPGVARFDSRPANDWPGQIEAAPVEPAAQSLDVPMRWIVALTGAALAALLGVFLGGAMAL